MFSMAYIVSTAFMLFLVLDPLGNLPLFISLLRRHDGRTYRRIVVRESFFALAVLLLFLFFGSDILTLLQVSEISLELAGGVILFLIALKMVFGVSQLGNETLEREPYLVPLAIPLFAGPSAITMVILIRGTPNASLPGALLALVVAWGAALLILLAGRLLGRWLGERVLTALESLMGLLLTVIAVEMLLRGFRAIFQ